MNQNTNEKYANDSNLTFSILNHNSNCGDETLSFCNDSNLTSLHNNYNSNCGGGSLSFCSNKFTKRYGLESRCEICQCRTPYIDNISLKIV